MNCNFNLNKINYPVFKKSKDLNQYEKKNYKFKIKKLLKKNNAVIVAHYYTDPIIQEIADETGGCVADSLEMARFGKNHHASTLLVAGVRFMGETAKILSPQKTVLMPSLHAECSLDLNCQIEDFDKFCNLYPDRIVIVYANTSAAVKARADWVVTSSICVELVEYLHHQGYKIIWAPDRHLGRYVTQKTGANIISWKASCIVHEEFKIQALKKMKSFYPQAAILAHPESPQAIVDYADFVGSTSQLINAAKKISNLQIIVATDMGIFYKMKQAVPNKELLIAPTAGEGATCKSCAHCPWMALNSLEAIIHSLEHGQNTSYEIILDPLTCKAALLPLNRMLLFAEKLQLKIKNNI